MNDKIKVINLEILPVGDTSYGLLRDKNNRKDNLKKYIDAVGERWETLKEPIETFWTDHQEEYNKLKTMSPDSLFKDFLGQFNNEEDLLTKAKPEAVKEIDHILTEHETDSDLLKELKGVYAIAKDEVNEYITETGKMTLIIFLVNTIREFYLKTLPEYLESKREIDAKDIKWGNTLSELFNNLYSLESDEEAKDFKDLVEGVGEQLEKAEKLIKKETKDENKELIAKDTEIQKLKDKIARILKEVKTHYSKHKPKL